MANNFGILCLNAIRFKIKNMTTEWKMLESDKENMRYRWMNVIMYERVRQTKYIYRKEIDDRR